MSILFNNAEIDFLVPFPLYKSRYIRKPPRQK